jgi:HAD superfamily hydrolase (TIGR01509 family)
MNIIIPLCGKGERFAPHDKPTFKVFNKNILDYAIDSLRPKENKIHIIVNNRTILRDFRDDVNIVNVYNETSGASETVLLGINALGISGGFFVVDGDNFYTTDICAAVAKNPEQNQVISFFDTQKKPVFSYVDITEGREVLAIKEKERISNYANTGAYYFADAEQYRQVASIIVENRIHHFKGEPYISSVINYMLNNGVKWHCKLIDRDHYYSLGTPEQVNAYMNSTYAFLFDLDGTLVNTDKVYYKAWEKILRAYNIFLTDEIYRKYIYSNTDQYVKESLLQNIPISLADISKLKEDNFDEFIGEIEVIDGAVEYIQKLRKHAHKIAIVTNSNRRNAENVLKTIGIDPYVDYLIIGSECAQPKPYPYPYLKAMESLKMPNKKCVIFEDSHNGLISAKSVSPKCIVGIGSNRSDLAKSGAQIIYSDFRAVDTDKLINYMENHSEKYIDWIYKSLQKKIKIDPKSIYIRSTALKGGFIADVYKVIFNDDRGVSYNAVFKVENINDSPLNKIAHDLQLYNRENYFYETISAHVPVAVPHFYGLIRNDAHDVAGILLENLDKKDYHLNLDLNNEPVETSLAVIDSMAKLHASFWEKNLTEKFCNLKKNNDPCFNPRWSEFIRQRIDAFVEKWGPILSEKEVAFFRENAANFQDVQESLSCEPLTLVHGDVKSPNIFFKKMESKIEPYFIDWQYIAYAKGVQDLVFFMIESFSKDKLNSYFDIFKNYYYIKLGEYGVKNYTVEKYNTDFLNAAKYFPFFVALWFGTTPTEDLIDMNFPYFFIDRLANFYRKLVA